jgi:hypothetical protein
MTKGKELIAAKSEPPRIASACSSRISYKAVLFYSHFGFNLREPFVGSRFDKKRLK